jgi:anti-sigma B factor antagonist
MSHAAPVFTLQIERSGDTAIAHCRGRLVAGETNNLYLPVSKMLPDIKRLVLDLSDVAFMDSMGLGTLVRLYVSAKSNGCKLELIHLGKRIRQLLGVAGLLNIFTVIGEQGIPLKF